MLHYILVKDMKGNGSSDMKRLKMYASIAYDSPEDLTQEDIDTLSMYCKSDDSDILLITLQILLKISEEQPMLVLPAVGPLVDIMKDSTLPKFMRVLATKSLHNVDSDPNVNELLTAVKESNKGSAQNNNSSVPTTLNSLAKNAQSDTVTSKRLRGRETYFFDVTPYLQSGEQPHFLFALSSSWGVKYGCFSVDKRGSEEAILKRSVTGSVVVSDYGVRVISEQGRWALSYTDITSSDMEAGSSRYTPTLKIVASGEIYRAKTAKSIHTKGEVSSASEYINKKIGRQF